MKKDTGENVEEKWLRTVRSINNNNNKKQHKTFYKRSDDNL